MGAEVIRIGAAAAVIDDEPNVERLGLVGALPGLAQQTRLVLGRERGRLADVHVGRAKTDDGADDRVDDVVGGDDEEAHRTADALGERDDVREQPPLVRRRRALAGRLLATSTSSSLAVIDHDVAIPGASEARPRRERARCGLRTGTSTLPGRASIWSSESSARAAGRTCLRRSSCRQARRCAGHREPHAQRRDQRSGGDGRDVADRDHRQRAQPRQPARPPTARTASRVPRSRRFIGAWNGIGPERVRRSRASAAIVSTSMTAMAIAYARASHATRPPLASTTRIMAATVTSIARAGVPNRA